MTSSIQELVAQARSQIRNLIVDEFARELEADTVTLIDIREPDEAGRTGAIQAPRGMLEFWAAPASPVTARSSTPRRGPCSTAHRAVAQRGPSQSRRTLGYTDVAHLDGGLKAWAEHGRPVTHHAPN